MAEFVSPEGIPSIVASKDAGDALEASILAIAAYQNPPLNRLFDLDPNSGIGHLYKAILQGLAHNSREAVLPAIKQARECYADPKRTKATWREEQLLEAIDLWSSGHLKASMEVVDGLLLRYPTDYLALRFSTDGNLFLGRSLGYANTVSGVLGAWDAQQESKYYPYVNGMMAFGLGETNRFEQAMDYAQKAYSLTTDRHQTVDVWAIHSAGHVYEYQGLPKEGLHLMDEVMPGWKNSDLLKGHCWWHYGLFAMQIWSVEKVMDQIYQPHLHNTSPHVAFPLVDASSFLWRLRLQGRKEDLPQEALDDRLSELAEAWGQFHNNNVLAFNDVHLHMATAGGGPGSERARMSDMSYAAMRNYIRKNEESDRPSDNSEVTSRLGLPMSEALDAYAEGDYGRATELLAPMGEGKADLGCSNAQRDIFDKTLISAACQSPRPEHALLARSLASRRSVLLPHDPWTATMARWSTAPAPPKL